MSNWTWFHISPSAHVISVLLLLLADYWDHDHNVKESCLLDTRNPLNLQPESPWRPLFDTPNGNTLDEDPTEYDSDGVPYSQRSASKPNRRSKGQRDRSRSFSRNAGGDRSRQRSHSSGSSNQKRSSSIGSWELHLSDSDEEAPDNAEEPAENRGYQKMAFTHVASPEPCSFCPLRLRNDTGSHCWLSAALVLALYGKRREATGLGLTFDRDNLPTYDNGFDNAFRMWSELKSRLLW